MKENNNRNLILQHLNRNIRSVIFAEPWMMPATMFLDGLSGYREAHGIEKFLVIAQKKILELEWLPTLKGGDIQGLSYAFALDKEKTKKEAYNSGSLLVLTNDESLEWLTREKIPENCCIVLDELSRYRHLRSEKYMILRKICAVAKGMIAFSRFPLPHGVDEVWEEMYLIDRGMRLGKTKNAFEERYFFVSSFQTGSRFKKLKEPKIGAYQAIGRAISDICLNLSDDRYKLPGLVKRYNTYVELDYKEMSKYQLLKNRLKLDLSDGHNITASDENAASIKLLQLANGTVYDDDHSVVYFHDKKILKLRSLTEEFAGRNVIVACWFKHEMERIRNSIPGSCIISTAEDINCWNEGRIKIGIINASLGGTYKDLSKGGNVIIWFSLPWALRLYNKTNERIFGEDTSETVIVNIIARDTIDEAVIKVLDTNKRDLHGLIKEI